MRPSPRPGSPPHHPRRFRAAQSLMWGHGLRPRCGSRGSAERVPRENRGGGGRCSGGDLSRTRGPLREGGPGKRSAVSSSCQACPGGARCPRRGTDCDRGLGTAICNTDCCLCQPLLFSRISQLEERKAVCDSVSL